MSDSAVLRQDGLRSSYLSEIFQEVKEVLPNTYRLD